MRRFSSLLLIASLFAVVTLPGIAHAETVAPTSDGRDTDWLWLEGGAGIGQMNLRALKNTNFLPSIVGTSGSGFAIEGAAGMKFFRVLAFGVRGTYGSYTTFGLGTLEAAVDLRIPIWVFEPYLRLGFGYAWSGGPNLRDAPDLKKASVFGFAATFGVGIDVYPLNFLSLGVGLDADVLNLTRDNFTSNPAYATDVDLTKSGHAVGYQLIGHAHVTIHL